jgi:hypothetical protein
VIGGFGMRKKLFLLIMLMLNIYVYSADSVPASDFWFRLTLSEKITLVSGVLSCIEVFDSLAKKFDQDDPLSNLIIDIEKNINNEITNSAQLRILINRIDDSYNDPKMKMIPISRLIIMKYMPSYN